VLREDNRAVVRAASQASEATDYLLSFLPADVTVSLAKSEHAV
jgi:antirestriction protein ArdC